MGLKEDAIQAHTQQVARYRAYQEEEERKKQAELERDAVSFFVKAFDEREPDRVLYDGETVEIVADGIRLSYRPGTHGSYGHIGEAVRVHVKERSISAKGMLVAEGIWDRLELPLTGIPALLDEAEGIWAISIRSDGPFSKRGRRKAVADDDELESPPY